MEGASERDEQAARLASLLDCEVGTASRALAQASGNLDQAINLIFDGAQGSTAAGPSPASRGGASSSQQQQSQGGDNPLVIIDTDDDVAESLADAEASDVSDHAQRNLRKVSQKVLEVRSNRRDGLGELSPQYFIDSALRLQKICRVNPINGTTAGMMTYEHRVGPRQEMTFQAGLTGLVVAPRILRMAKVENVTGQAKVLGVRRGWQIVSVDDEEIQNNMLISTRPLVKATKIKFETAPGFTVVEAAAAGCGTCSGMLDEITHYALSLAHTKLKLHALPAAEKDWKRYGFKTIGHDCNGLILMEKSIASALAKLKQRLGGQVTGVASRGGGRPSEKDRVGKVVSANVKSVEQFGNVYEYKVTPSTGHQLRIVDSRLLGVGDELEIKLIERRKIQTGSVPPSRWTYAEILSVVPQASPTKSTRTSIEQSPWSAADDKGLQPEAADGNGWGRRLFQSPLSAADDKGLEPQAADGIGEGLGPFHPESAGSNGEGRRLFHEDLQPEAADGNGDGH